MNNPQNISIIVVCNSELVLTGFTEILKPCTNFELIVIKRSDELIDYQALRGSVLVIATSDEQENSSAFIRKVLSASQHIKFLTLNMNSDVVYSNETINLFDAPSLICFKVNEVVNSFLAGQNTYSDAELCPPRSLPFCCW